MTFDVILINSAILPKSMGFDCWIVLVHKNTKLRWCELESDSLVNDRILRESSNKLKGMLASPIKRLILLSRFSTYY